jgi:hypothetical protein
VIRPVVEEDSGGRTSSLIGIDLVASSYQFQRCTDTKQEQKGQEETLEAHGRDILPAFSGVAV